MWVLIAGAGCLLNLYLNLKINTRKTYTVGNYHYQITRRLILRKCDWGSLVVQNLPTCLILKSFRASSTHSPIPPSSIIYKHTRDALPVRQNAYNIYVHQNLSLLEYHSLLGTELQLPQGHAAVQRCQLLKKD